jgi:hypothetical protein
MDACGSWQRCALVDEVRCSGSTDGTSHLLQEAGRHTIVQAAYPLASHQALASAQEQAGTAHQPLASQQVTRMCLCMKSNTAKDVLGGPEVGWIINNTSTTMFADTLCNATASQTVITCRNVLIVSSG